MPKKASSVDVFKASRRLIRESRSATLATALTGKRTGWPYASLVTVACGMDAAPILLLSGLADHSRNLADDDRASLLFEAATHLPNPQTGPRLTVTGRLRVTDDETLAQRFLARHPGARRYAGFGDFQFYEMTVERGHFVGGFGRAQWFAANRLLFDGKASDALGRDEARTVERLNRENAEDIARIAQNNFGGRGKNWKLTGGDPEGVDFQCRNSFRRLDFKRPVGAGRGLRTAVLGLDEKK